jgi:hypothetical protein
LGAYACHFGDNQTSKLGGIIYRAVLAWAKRTSQVIDCEAIGGSGGWKGIAQNWAGEERTRTFGLIQAAPRARQASLEGPLIQAVLVGQKLT